MIDILNRFLFQNKSISIPGLGTIHAERVPARMDAVNERIIAPSYRFRFDKYFDAPDKHFFTYLSVQRKIPDFEAMRQYNQFAQEFRAGIMTEETLVWDEIGFFRKNSSGEIEFVQTGYNDENYLALPFISSAQTDATQGVTEIDAPEKIDIPEQPLMIANEPERIEVREEKVSTEDTLPEIVDFTPQNRLEKTLFYVAWALLVLAIAALVLYFGQYGLSTRSWANCTPLTMQKSLSE